MGFTDFLRDAGEVAKDLGGAAKDFGTEIAAAAQYVPIIGSYVGIATDQDDLNETMVHRGASGGFEALMSGMNWAYDNGVSQPLSTALLQSRRSDMGALFSASEWVDAWQAAENISPGQAAHIQGGWEGLASTAGGLPGLAATKLFGDGEDEALKAINSPLVRPTPGAFTEIPGWEAMSFEEQQEILKEAGIPRSENAYVEQMRRDSTFFKYASGALDFGVRWYADPTVLAGKAIGAARMKWAVNPRPQGGWSQSEIAKLLDTSKMQKARDFLWANKDNPALINNLSMVRRSAMGPRFGGILSQLQSPQEVTLLLRTTMGDVRARAVLERVNARAAHRMQQDVSRLSSLELYLGKAARHNNNNLRQMAQQRADQLKKQIGADTDMVNRYRQTLDHYAELDALNMTRWSMGRAQRRTRAQRDYRAGPAAPSRRPGAGPRVRFAKVPSDFWGTGVTVMRSFGEAHPNGVIRVDDILDESVDELRGHVARIPGIGPDIRQDILNRYLKTTTEGERLDLLDEVNRLGVKKIAERHGLAADDGLDIYREHQRRTAIGRDVMDRRYSAATRPGRSGQPTEFVDEFLDSGGALSVHPNMATKLANHHIMMDLSELNKVLARHGSALRALRVAGGKASDLTVDGMDFFNHLWKFGTLFRVGYIPRVLGDDILGQAARLGAANMVMRATRGGKNLLMNTMLYHRPAYYEAREAVQRQGIRYADGEIARIKPGKVKLERKIKGRQATAARAVTRAQARVTAARARVAGLPPTATPARVGAAKKLLAQRQTDLKNARGRMKSAHSGREVAKLDGLQRQLDDLTTSRAKAVQLAERAKTARESGFRVRSQLRREPEIAGVKLPAALEGERGAYFQKLISADDSLRNLFATNKQMIHHNLQAAYGNAGRSISYPQGADQFVAAWHKAINHQIMQDGLAVQAVKGATPQEMAKWLRTTAPGRAYLKRLGLKHESVDNIAASVWHEVDQYLPTPVVRKAALDGEADVAFLAQAAKQGERPAMVHTTDLGESLAGSNHVRRGLDRVIDGWFKVAASLPADRMSRHPLFNQLYEGHAKTIIQQEMKQGAKVTQKEADRIAETARRLALKDTRRLVFDIAHRSDAAHALRFISPFFSATTEAWQRWARIIADRPQTVGYAGMIYNAPASWGWMQDSNGNQIGADGYAYDPVSGKRYLVPKSDRFIMARVPKEVVNSSVGKALGLNGDGRWLISQDSMNFVTQGDPFFNPGVGPIVSIPVSEWTRDKPSQAELARHLGILPFGPETSTLFGDSPVGRGLSQAMPATIKNFLTAFDTSDARYQRIKLQIMQRAAYQHKEFGAPMPSAKEIADRTRSYWLKSAAWSFLSPASTQRPDKYEFFRQQYRNLRRKDYLTADEEFLNRYGDSMFVFAASTSDTSMPPTKKAVKLFQENREMVAQFPELATLIIGPNAQGPFSPEAWAYSLTTPLKPGDAEMITRKLSADEAMRENKEREGWAKYTQLINYITAQMQSAGYDSFTDKGAEGFANMRAAVSAMMSTPGTEGEPNPHYNEEWSKAFYTLDRKKYDRLIPKLEAIASSDLAKEESRTDLRSLRKYLDGRRELLTELARRAAAGEPVTLAAKANEDLAIGWARYVDDLIEKDTRFGDLHSRYLSRDLGVDVDTLAEDEEI